LIHSSLIRVVEGLPDALRRMFEMKLGMVYVMYLLKLADLNIVANYNWSFAILAYLYRGLDHDIHLSQNNIGGYMILFLCWAYERITCIGPHAYNFFSLLLLATIHARIQIQH